MLKLRGDWVLVKPIVEDKTPGGIYLSDGAKEGSMLARVVAVGPGRKREELYIDQGAIPNDGKRHQVTIDTGTGTTYLEGRFVPSSHQVVKRRFVRIPVEVPIGAVIIIPRWAGHEIKVDGENHLLLREYQCLAVVEGYDE